MNRMEYYNSIYDKFWQRQTHRYGVTEYEKVVLNSILKKKCKKCFFLCNWNWMANRTKTL